MLGRIENIHLNHGSMRKHPKEDMEGQMVEERGDPELRRGLKRFKKRSIQGRRRNVFADNGTSPLSLCSAPLQQRADELQGGATGFDPGSGEKLSSTQSTIARQAA